MSTAAVIALALLVWFAVSVAFVATCGERLGRRLRDRQPPPDSRDEEP